MLKQQRSARLGRVRLIVVRDTGAHPVKGRRSVRYAKRAAIALAALVAVAWVLAHLVDVVLVAGLIAYAARLMRVW